MLVLTRKLQETIQIGDNIKITVLRAKGNTVRIGIEAPSSISVLRGELAERRKAEANAGGQIEQSSSSEDTAGQPETPKRGSVSRMPLSNPRQSLADPKPAANDESTAVTHQKMSRSKVSSVLPQMLGESGPLRSMLDRRTQCVAGS